jgi:hypothetical protein
VTNTRNGCFNLSRQSYDQFNVNFATERLGRNYFPPLPVHAKFDSIITPKSDVYAEGGWSHIFKVKELRVPISVADASDMSTKICTSRFARYTSQNLYHKFYCGAPRALLVASVDQGLVAFTHLGLIAFVAFVTFVTFVDGVCGLCGPSTSSRYRRLPRY